jgi:long-subunit fatty acid transport protein
MWKRAVGISVLGVLASVAPAAAQHLEVSGIFGWSISDGVTGDPTLAQDGNLYNEIDVKDSASWGFSVGYQVNEQFEVGFLYNQQLSTMLVKGSTEREVGDLHVANYHPYIAFNAGDPDAKVRPYFLIGFGATHYPSVSFTGLAGAARETFSATQFSTTWGVGVKAYPSPHFGIRAGVQWTPTYIKSDAEGWWCDPWYGCYVVGDAQYSNQLQFSGGVTARF